MKAEIFGLKTNMMVIAITTAAIMISTCLAKATGGDDAVEREYGIDQQNLPTA